MKEEVVTVTDAREQLVSLSERRTALSQCRCTCFHNGGDSGCFKGWGAIQCSTACGLPVRELPGSKSASKECISMKAAAGKRRASSGDKTRVNHLLSRSVPSLFSQDQYNVSGTEMCSLRPHEQALYYRRKVTYDAARKSEVVHTYQPPRKKREAELIAPQVATKGPGLQITPVHKPSHRSLDPRGVASVESLQTGSRTTAAKQGTYGSKGSRDGAKKKLEQESRVHWAHSMKHYQHNHSVVDKELNKDGNSTKRPTMLQCRRKNQFTHYRFKMLQYQPDLKTGGRRGAGWLEGEGVCSMPALHDTTSSSSETLLTTPLKCFPLGPSVTDKDHKAESSSKKPACQQKEKKKNSKGKGPCPSRPVVPPLGHSVHGVVYNSQQPANLLQHRCQVSFMGMQKGFRYETLCLQGYGRNSPPLMVVGPWITASR